LAALFIYFPLS